MATDKPQPGTPAWAKYWAGRIAEAQQQRTVDLGGTTYQRTPYGEDYPDGKPQCRDCGVAKGQLHVANCCVERCPRCDGQAISCKCLDGDDTTPPNRLH
jgi:hypothetical protein